MKTMLPANTRMLALTSLFTALTVVGAQLRVPLPLVPFSMQDFFVVLSGLVLGPKHGALSQILYLVLGLAGLPIFTKGGGPAYVLQPTFGYLLGFPVASFIAGKVLQRTGNPTPATWPRLILACALAVLALLTLGVFYLWCNTNWIIGAEMTLWRAIYIGALVFLPGQVLKICAAGFLYRALQPRMGLHLIAQRDA